MIPMLQELGKKACNLAVLCHCRSTVLLATALHDVAYLGRLNPILYTHFVCSACRRKRWRSMYGCCDTPGASDGSYLSEQQNVETDHPSIHGPDEGRWHIPSENATSKQFAGGPAVLC